MGIPGLINAIGVGERVSLAKLAGSHLERNARPIRIAVDISIWLFQVQASRGGKNPELRTLYFRLLKILALPIHPLFVYDGRHKPPFKRGKAVSRGSGNLPIIQRSKDLIERFRFPWHEAPGEAEAECARLQQAGIVDAVISNDVDALMFGSTFTMMNFSNESGSGSSGATHVTCYYSDCQGYVSNVPLDRAGMILFAMLSGGDYLPSGVEKCGPGTSAEIAKAGFGEDLLQMVASGSPSFEAELGEWRERLQHELESNESGYFARKHPAVRIPDTFPDPAILEYYARPKVSSEEEMAILRDRLKHAWDLEIDPLAIRSFAAENLDWKYRSGARKVIKNLAEPLVSYRLRRQRPVKAHLPCSLAPKCDITWLQKVYKTRASFGTDGMTEFQVDMLPIDVVGLDLMAEEPNPPPSIPVASSAQDLDQAEGEEDEAEPAADNAQSATTAKPRATKRYDVYDVQKIWVLESVVRLGLPAVVQRWEAEQAEKARKAAAPKKSSSRKPALKKKGVIDPAMKRGSILKYGTLTKERSELFTSKKSMMLESVSAKEQAAFSRESSSSAVFVDLEDGSITPSTYPQQENSVHMLHSSCGVDALASHFSSLTTKSRASRVKRNPTPQESQTTTRVGVGATADGSVKLDGSRTSPRAGSSIECQGFVDTARLSTNGSKSVSESRASTSGGATAEEFTCSSIKSKSKAQTASCVTSERKRAFLNVDHLQHSIQALSLSEVHDGKYTRDSTLGCSPDSKSQKRHLDRNRPFRQATALKSLSSAMDETVKRKEEITPSASRPNGYCRNTQTGPSEVTPDAKKSQSTLGSKRDYVENVVALNGFWEIDPDSAAVTRDISSQSALRAGTTQKKRFAHVCIVDLT
ncbi:hypothetical protein PDE_05102 [Penicillium oxalicum 114-2]|uniref:XPG-I domain-containing protein n=1 Tax=Penicillium oxalicum (strain 114-2 / CGMCC 5302) TaxID=933388 RepID=S8B679_PENO1|nr:hypothetical protein PDE_05102 [Penicillium oxalicum 114-2]